LFVISNFDIGIFVKEVVMNCYWIENTEHEIAKLRKASKGVAVLPCASIESHGPHLPLGNDILNLKTALERILKREIVAVLPVVEYSSVVEARMLPGAIHMPTPTLMDLVEAICDEVHRNGFKKIILLHGHGGNVALHEAFMKRVLEKEKTYAVYSLKALGSKYATHIKPLCETKELDHACEMETSMSMASHPALVHVDRLGKRTFPTQPGPNVGGAATPVDWTARHPYMAVGMPQKATRQKGEKMFKIWVDEAVDMIRRVKKDGLTLRALKSYAKRANRARKG
jgi:creatinine amidohydrolase